MIVCLVRLLRQVGILSRLNRQARDDTVEPVKETIGLLHIVVKECLSPRSLAIPASQNNQNHGL
jgi:hypothetical protein